MAVPKKRTGHSAQGHRRANWKATKPETTKCLNCGALVLTHTVCTACGYYKGKAVSIKSPDYSETTIEPKKPAKKTSTKKSEAKTEEVKSKKTKVKSEVETVKEVKAETVEAVEDVKTEETKSE
jgi:large subunit ribosomal protein L32